MSQRNPLNDRYQTDERQGQTRKSAASMKPKTKAAASVRMQSTQKTKQQIKAEKKAARAKQAEIDRMYYNPPTPEYRKLRKLWWALLFCAIATTMLSFAFRSFLPEAVSYISLIFAYGFIIAAMYIDFSKIKKVRRAYQAEMMSKKSKAGRALEKQQRAQERAAKQQEAARAGAAEAQPKKPGLFEGLFGRKKASGTKAEKAAEDKNGALQNPDK